MITKFTTFFRSKENILECIKLLIHVVKIERRNNLFFMKYFKHSIWTKCILASVQSKY